MITTIYKGYTLTVAGKVWVVMGSRKLRKHYFYIVRDVYGHRASIDRDGLMQMQREGTVTIRH